MGILVTRTRVEHQTKLDSRWLMECALWIKQQFKVIRNNRSPSFGISSCTDTGEFLATSSTTPRSHVTPTPNLRFPLVRIGCDGEGAIIKYFFLTDTSPCGSTLCSMNVRIRLARFGRKNLPFYRVFVADSRCPRDGKHLEVVGHYDPMPGGYPLSFLVQYVIIRFQIVNCSIFDQNLMYHQWYHYEP